MKLIFIQPTADKRGHYGIYTVNVCQGLAKLGHEVTLFTNKVHPEKFLKEKVLFTVIEWREGAYSFEHFDELKNTQPMKYTWGYLRNSFFILKAGLRFAKGKNFDIVQVFDTEYSIAGLLFWIYGKTLPIILMVNAPNFSYSEFTGPRIIKIYKEFQKKILKKSLVGRVRGVNMLGEFHAREFRKQFDLPAQFPIAVIYDGADAPEVPLDKSTARAKIGVSYSGPLFLFFGMMRKDKGIEYLLQAVSLLEDENFRLLLAGSLFDYQERDILKLINDLKIGDKVITKFDYIGDKEVYDYFFASDALILPYISLYRGGSGPLLKEAAVCKVPAIVSDVSEMGPLVRKYKMGLVVEPENPEALSKAVRTFLSLSNEAKQKMGENAFKAANTWSSMAKKYEEFYKTI